MGLYNTHVTSRVSLDVIFTHIMVQIPVWDVDGMKATASNDFRPNKPSIRQSLDLQAQWPIKLLRDPLINCSSQLSIAVNLLVELCGTRQILIPSRARVGCLATEASMAESGNPGEAQDVSNEFPR